MARSNHNDITESLLRILPARKIRNLAKKLGVVQRRRKLDIVALVASLVLGFSCERRRTLSGLRRAYLFATGVRLAPSSFHARFTRGLTELMRTLAFDALQHLGQERPALHGLFAPFVEVLAADSSLIRLHDALATHYPSVWTNHTKASAKLDMVMNIVGRSPKHISLTHGSRHDVHLLKAGPWMKGRLLLFDLGLCKAALFERIEHFGGYFLSRLPATSNPLIVQSHQPAHRHLVGYQLKDAQALVQDELIDVVAQREYQKDHRTRPYVTTHHQTLRCIAVYNHDLGQWHRYVANLAPALLNAEHAAAIYAARWEVELLFRELKSHYRIAQLPSSNQHVTETLLYAALLSLVLSRKLYRVLHPRDQVQLPRLPLDRWAILFAHVASKLLVMMLRPNENKSAHKRLLLFLRKEAINPNKTRLPLAYRAQQGIGYPP